MSASLHERDRYRVRLVIHTADRVVEFTKYAESPEHAIDKAKKELGPGYEVVEASAEKLAD